MFYEDSEMSFNVPEGYVIVEKEVYERIFVGNPELLDTIAYVFAKSENNDLTNIISIIRGEESNNFKQYLKVFEINAKFLKKAGFKMLDVQAPRGAFDKIAYIKTSTDGREIFQTFTWINKTTYCGTVLEPSAKEEQILLDLFKSIRETEKTK